MEVDDAMRRELPSRGAAPLPRSVSLPPIATTAARNQGENGRRARHSWRVIWFLRHGEAEDTTPDFERRLTAKGERQARHAGSTLAALGVEIDLCLTSPRVRALDTARLACEALPGVEPATEERLQ